VDSISTRAKMKTLKLALAGTALAGALATSAIAADCSFSGFYLGAQLGAGTTNTEAKNTVTATGVSNKSNLAATGAIGGLHVGYGKQFPNRFYLGLEAYGNLSSNNQSSTDSRLNQIKTQRNNAFGLALRPGFVWGNALLYAKLGVESANFKYSTTLANGAGSGSNSGRRTGFVPGLGVAFNAAEHVMLGVEATHTFYNSRTANTSSPAGVTLTSTKFQSQATDFFARASYKW